MKEGTDSCVDRIRWISSWKPTMQSARVHQEQLFALTVDMASKE